MGHFSNDYWRDFGFRGLSRDLQREAAIQRDNDGWWLREFAFARWAADTVYPQAIERVIHEIGDQPQWK